MPPRFDISFTGQDEAEKHWNRRTEYNLALDDAIRAMKFFHVCGEPYYDREHELIDKAIAAIEGLRRIK
jgi:hypothetical protein